MHYNNCTGPDYDRLAIVALALWDGRNEHNRKCSPWRKMPANECTKRAHSSGQRNNLVGINLSASKNRD